MSKHVISPSTKGTKLLLLGLVVGLGGFLPVLAHAATFNVANGDVVGLIAAINTANSSPGADTITLAAGGTYTLTAIDNGTEGNNGLPAVTSQITINGNGATIERSSVAGTPSFRMFFIPGPGAGNLTLNGVTIRGCDSLTGGAIRNQGNLAVSNSSISGNYGQSAGAIWNQNGTVTITGSTIRNNRSFYYGAVWNEGNGAVLTATNSTFSDNQSDGYRGGGIVNVVGAVTLTNSTVSGNTSAGQGAGGIWNWLGGSTLTLINSTVSGNTGNQYAGGIRNSGGTLKLVNSTVTGNRDVGGGAGGIGTDGVGGATTLKNTIVANNSANDCVLISPVTSLGHNIAGDGTCALTGAGDMNSSNPQLGPLANTGGPTHTHAPLSGSPAIDAVPIADCTDSSGNPLATDQRGIARPQGPACDIGSVEARPSNGQDTVFVGDHNGAGNASPLYVWETGWPSLVHTTHPPESLVQRSRGVIARHGTGAYAGKIVVFNATTFGGAQIRAYTPGLGDSGFVDIKANFGGSTPIHQIAVNSECTRMYLGRDTEACSPRSRSGTSAPSPTLR